MMANDVRPGDRQGLFARNFGIKEKKAATANKALVDAATCQMLGNP
ncbi:hypothetical protein ACWDCC_43215 [Streptomyces sp. NPDC001102]